ncbi:MAG: nuclear transport factor 2 family protein [Dehalococcoidia bacterium]
MSMIDSEAMDRMIARQAIGDLLMAYARGVDRCDVELLQGIFHPDATVVTGLIDGRGTDFPRKIVDHVQRKLDRCFHSIAQMWIEVSGDHAVGESYFIAVTAAAGRDGIIAGRYLNEFERRAGVWKIQRHTIVMDWSTTQPTGAEADSLFKALRIRGSANHSDPLYGHWQRLRTVR